MSCLYLHSVGAQREKRGISFGNETQAVSGEGDTSYLSIEEGWTFTRKRKGIQDTGSFEIATWSYEETHHIQEMITEPSRVGVQIGKTDRGHTGSSMERQAKDLECIMCH